MQVEPMLETAGSLKEAHAVLERDRIIRQSRRDVEVFFKALEPPAQNARLKKAVAAYKRSLCMHRIERFKPPSPPRRVRRAGPELFMPPAMLLRALNEP